MEVFAALGGEDGFAGLPGGFEVGAEDLATDSQEGLGPGLAPEHSGLLHAPADDGFASGFDDSAADEVSFFPEVAVAGAPGVGLEVFHLSTDGFELLGGHLVTPFFEESAGGGEDGFDAGSFEFFGPAGLEGSGFFAAGAFEGSGEGSEVFGGVVEVEDLDGSGEVEAGVVPNPGGSVSEVDGLFYSSVTPAQGLVMEEGSDFAAAAHGADVAGGGGVADGFGVFVGGGLGEDAAEFGFAGFGSAVGLFSFVAFEFFLAEGDAGAVAGDVEDGGFFLIRRRGFGRKGGEGLREAGAEVADEPVEAAAVEGEAGVGQQVFGGLKIRTALAAGAANESGEGGGGFAGEVEGVVKGGVSGFGFAVVVVISVQGDGSEEGSDLEGTLCVDGFVGAGRLFVGDQGAVVEEAFDDAAGVPEEGVAQAGFEPVGQVLGSFFFVEARGDLREEGFGFAVFFFEACFPEFFFEPGSAPRGPGF